MLARVRSATLCGVEAAAVSVEVDVTPGLPCFATVGLPDSTVRESRDRIRAAIRNAGFEFPIERITVNLAPADLRKEGAAFDLPMALGILAATGLIKPDRLERVADPTATILSAALMLEYMVPVRRGPAPRDRGRSRLPRRHGADARPRRHGEDARDGAGRAGGVSERLNTPPDA